MGRPTSSLIPSGHWHRATQYWGRPESVLLLHSAEWLPLHISTKNRAFWVYPGTSFFLDLRAFSMISPRRWFSRSSRRSSLRSSRPELPRSEWSMASPKDYRTPSRSIPGISRTNCKGGNRSSLPATYFRYSRVLFIFSSQRSAARLGCGCLIELGRDSGILPETP